MSNFKQEPHKLLVIPGPIEVTDEVLYANAHPSMSHVSPDFIPVFGDCIRMIREVLFAGPQAQPFIISGSGTLGWDQVSANLVEPGESVLVLNSGYFGDSFADCLRTYGAVVDELHAPFGTAVELSSLEAALKSKKYKLVTFTHVDTSTGVLSDAKGIAEVVKSASPETLVALDGVCSVASEEIQMDAWGIDVVLTASQKGLGVPPGLSILVASEKAMKVFEARKSPVTSYYGSWKKWLPIMRAYENGSAAYFATPPVNLIYAFHTSLTQLTKRAPSLQERFALHREASARVKKAAEELGLRQLPLDSKYAANGMTALYFPDGLVASDLLPRLGKRDVIVAGGLHKDHKEKYFRIGHMGVSVVDKMRGDIDKVIAALKESLAEAKASKNV
ncbi:PLP-dependent transferase [Cubamyces menziesii]|nr:PLP-dependent transferase [Cubamyces menziesii]